MTVRLVLRCLLAGAALLGGSAGAHPPPPPLPVAPVPVGFAQAQRVLLAARNVVAALSVSRVVRADRALRVVLLSVDGQVVTRVALRPDGTLAPMPDRPQKLGPASEALTAAERTDLNAQVAALTVSGAVQATRGDYRVPLLSGGVVVAMLRLDRVNLRPLADPVPPRPPGPGGG